MTVDDAAEEVEDPVDDLTDDDDATDDDELELERTLDEEDVVLAGIELEDEDEDAVAGLDELLVVVAGGT